MLTTLRAKSISDDATSSTDTSEKRISVSPPFRRVLVPGTTKRYAPGPQRSLPRGRTTHLFQEGISLCPLKRRVASSLQDSEWAQAPTPRLRLAGHPSSSSKMPSCRCRGPVDRRSLTIRSLLRVADGRQGVPRALVPGTGVLALRHFLWLILRVRTMSAGCFRVGGERRSSTDLAAL